MAKDKSASISISIDSAQGMALKDLAAAFSKELSGSAPVLDKDDGSYMFTFKKGAVESTSFIDLDDAKKEYILIVITGEHPQVESILGSLEDK